VEVGKDRDTELGHMREASNVNLEQTIMQWSFQGKLVTLLADLTNQEREVVCILYGLCWNQDYSIDYACRVLGLSSEQVCRIESRAWQTLCESKSFSLLQDYFRLMNQ
jgi:RNA polymerase nonessential primary-like sigma factor